MHTKLKWLKVVLRISYISCRLVKWTEVLRIFCSSLCILFLYVYLYVYVFYFSQTFKISKKNDDKLKPNKNYLNEDTFLRLYSIVSRWISIQISLRQDFWYATVRFLKISNKNDDKLKKPYPLSLSLSLLFERSLSRRFSKRLHHIHHVCDDRSEVVWGGGVLFI